MVNIDLLYQRALSAGIIEEEYEVFEFRGADTAVTGFFTDLIDDRVVPQDENTSAHELVVLRITDLDTFETEFYLAEAPIVLGQPVWSDARIGPCRQVSTWEFV